MKLPTKKDIVKAGYIEVKKNRIQHVPKSFNLGFYQIPAKDHVFEILTQNDKFSPETKYLVTKCPLQTCKSAVINFSSKGIN